MGRIVQSNEKWLFWTLHEAGMHDPISGCSFASLEVKILYTTRYRVCSQSRASEHGPGGGIAI